MCSIFLSLLRSKNIQKTTKMHFNIILYILFTIFARTCFESFSGHLNYLNAKLNHICNLLALLGSHRILHIS